MWETKLWLTKVNLMLRAAGKTLFQFTTWQKITPDKLLQIMFRHSDLNSGNCFNNIYYMVIWSKPKIAQYERFCLRKHEYFWSFLSYILSKLFKESKLIGLFTTNPLRPNLTGIWANAKLRVLMIPETSKNPSMLLKTFATLGFLIPNLTTPWPVSLSPKNSGNYF